MKVFFAAVVMAVACFLVSCSDISYIGNTYAPTTDVKFYMSPSSVPAGMYEKMGKISASGDAGSNSINEDIRKKAMQVGADAVVILSTSRRKTGTTVSGVSNTTTTYNNNRHHYDKHSRGRKNDYSRKYDTGTVTQKDIITEFVEAELLRRKNHVAPVVNNY